MITFMVYFVAFSCFSSLTVVLIGYMILPGALVASILLADKNETVFLDKCCILQTDRNAKLQGISRLSDYLRASDKLVVFWSPDYLKRLWCVYELAKFLETHEMKDVIIINLEHVKFCVWMMLGEGVGIIILEVLRIYLLENKMDTLLPHVLLWYFVSLFVGGRSAYYMDTTLTFRHIARTFKTSNAKCSDAADEPLLHDIIEDAYGSIESFEVVVRNLCLGDDKLGDNPTWLFSKATFQMLCLPFIPYVIGEALLSLFRALGRSTVPAYLIGAPASVVSTPLNVVCSVHAAVVPRVLFSCQAPMLLLVGYKWSIWGYHKNIPQTLVKLSMILFSVLYIWLGQVLQGRRIFDLSIVSFDMVKLLDAPSMLCFGILSVTILLALIQRGYQY
ncbi:hypothetical protein FOL47_004397 [Perkinsus chesapeaki]|uniref:TIR domain-containing protein n=1 Tax=Perkinsus chesapeaki TaxID=330153 RepID=A0A7J6MZ57_PERCH|nr:hypothetical protein FOL47_004397 [Perkinsus chesapeaki]